MIDDKYTYPGSGGVLVNKLNIREPDRLDAAMNRIATAGMTHLGQQGPPARPDAAYLQHVHRTLFSPVLEWAGQLRDVDTGAGGTSVIYARPAFIPAEMGRLFGRLEATDYLRGLPREEFADRLGIAWGDLTAIHPFRDGNTRSQSVYVSMLAARAGYEIDWPTIEVDHLREVRLAAVTGRDHDLRALLREHTTEITNEPGSRRRVTPDVARWVGHAPTSLDDDRESRSWHHRAADRHTSAGRDLEF